VPSKKRTDKRVKKRVVKKPDGRYLIYFTKTPAARRADV
jgi:hypothetical protein